MFTNAVGPVSWVVIVGLVGLLVIAVGMASHPFVDWRRLPVIGNVVRFLPARVDAVAKQLQARVGMSGAAMAAGVIGLAVVMALAVGFTALLDDVLEGEGIAKVDEPITHMLAGHREVWLTKLLVVITRLGNVDAQTVWLVLVCAVAALSARSWVPILVGVAGGGGIAVVIVIAKVLVGRPRPASPYAVMPVDGFSFPSGHATGASAVGLLGAWMLCHWVVRRWAAQVTVWTLTVGMIGMIGFSRCYLGVHFVTDVLAGWLLGAAWAVSVVLLAAWWPRAVSARRGLTQRGQ